MTKVRSRIATDIDFERPGKQTGYLMLPFSRPELAYGRVPIPVIVIANGTGPTALLMAGNHGDEFEGQIALAKLARDLAPDRIHGRVVILPAANLPAVEAGNRNSPLDSGNLNREFPGDPDGGPTQMIAHFIESVLLPMTDYAVDLHSGGASLVYSPCALVRESGPVDRIVRIMAAQDAFGAPLTYVTDGRNGGAERTFAAGADRSGVIAITAELGGGAAVSREALRIAEDGVRRLLVHAGILEGSAPPKLSPGRLLRVEGLDFYVFSQSDGIFEPLADLGDEVAAGQPAGLVHSVHTPWEEPQTATFRHSGLVICKRATGRTRRGDCLYQIATDHRPQSC